jgi:UDP-N-acetylglucosamine 1-carboxyvinyltransferase
MGASIDVTRGCLGRKPCRFADQDHFHSCIVRGPSKLRGKDMVIPDLRAGFANIIAALVADGVSNISGVRYIERGYAHVADKLASIGAAIEVRESAPAPVREPEPLVKKPSH